MMLERATSADVPAVVALMNVAFRGPVAGWNTEAAYIDGQRTSLALLTEEIAAKPDAALLLWRADSRLVGSVWLEPAGGAVWYLGSLTIDPQLQGSGAGGTLLAAAEAWAFARGARTIRMKVVNIRDVLIGWYERRFYRLTGETAPFPYGNHRFGIPRRDDLAFVVLEKMLSGAG